MQSTDCRRAFPCWDEPECKAVFGITLDIAEGLQAISNGPEVDRTEANGRVVIRFADTMIMSTYLVAFVVGRLEMSDTVDVNGSPMRVVHVPGKGHLTDFGMDVGAFCLRWFEEYYGIPYPSDKVDLAALPDFAAGAMENLGCITFRESLLLVDPDTSTQNEQQMVADVVAHELAHMWFGDLVTMRWWNGIWLNEAFATFMEIAACDAYRPDWERWTSFGLERSVAFDVDALESTRSVEYEVRSPADCEGMFDVLTYQKGGALLRMLEQYLGADRFREGVSHYLRLHSYKNTETNDLWDAIEATSGEPVRRIMDSWIWQPGFPLIRAEADRRRLGCRADPAAISSRSGARRRSRSDVGRAGPRPQRRHHDDRPARRRQRSSCRSSEPDASVVVNAGGHGFFRVAYDTTLRARLTDDLAEDEHARAVQPGRRCLVRHGRRLDVGARPAPVPRGFRRRARTCGLAGGRHRTARAGSSRGRRPNPGVPGQGPGPRAAGPGRPRRPAARRERPRPPSCGACCSAPPADWATTPTSSRCVATC